MGNGHIVTQEMKVVLLFVFRLVFYFLTFKNLISKKINMSASKIFENEIENYLRNNNNVTDYQYQGRVDWLVICSCMLNGSS